MLNAPHGYSIVSKMGRKKLVVPPGGVCRLRVGICHSEREVTTDERHADRMVDVLAMTESALREVVFLGEPLGSAGAAVAVRQAAALRLHAPMDTAVHGRVLKLFVRADVIFQYMASSPSLSRYLTASE